MADRDRENPPALRMVPDGRYADWEAIYRDNATWVYRTIFARVGNQPDAEDLTAEVFLAALGPLRISATIPEVRAYLRATARTALAAHWRATLGREITLDRGYRRGPGQRGGNQHGPPAGARRVGSAARQLPAGSWSCGSCRGAQSRTPRRKWVSAWPTPRCCNTAPCSGRHKLTGTTSDDRARVAAIYR